MQADCGMYHARVTTATRLLQLLQGTADGWSSWNWDTQGTVQSGLWLGCCLTVNRDLARLHITQWASEMPYIGSLLERAGGQCCWAESPVFCSDWGRAGAASLACTCPQSSSHPKGSLQYLLHAEQRHWRPIWCRCQAS